MSDRTNENNVHVWMWNDTSLNDPLHTILTLKDIKQLLINRRENIRKLKITKKLDLINYLKQTYDVTLHYSFKHLTKKELIVELKLRNLCKKSIQSKKKQFIIQMLQKAIPKRIKNKNINIIPWSNTEWRDLLINRFNINEIQQLLFTRYIQKRQFKHLKNNKRSLIEYLKNNCIVNLDQPIEHLTCSQIATELRLLQNNLRIDSRLHNKNVLVQFLKAEIRRHITYRLFINLKNNSIPNNYYAKPTRLNSNEFFIGTKTDGLYLYNILKNKWKQWIDYPWLYQDSPNIHNKATCVDEKNKIVYMYYLDGDWRMWKINYKTKPYKCEIYKNLPFVKFHHLLFVNEQIHLFSFYPYGQHWIWDDVDCKFNKIHQLKLCSGKLIHTAKNNKIIFIGRNHFGNSDIETYDTINKKWLGYYEMNIRGCMHFGGFYCLTRDERYLIMSKMDQNICVLDLNEMNVMNTDIKCPSGIYYEGIIMKDILNNELTVYGFVRLCWNKYKIGIHRFPPKYIITLMQTWYCNECLYIIESQARDAYGVNTNNSFKKHLKIRVDDILENAKCQ
eukprot:406790_1